MEGSTLTQRRGECRLEERAIQNDYLMDLGARLALVWQIQRDREKEMKRIWFETRKMPILIEENMRDVTNRPLTEFIAPCIDSLPPLVFTNRRPVPTILHPPSPLAICAQDTQRFIVFSYFVPETCHRSTGKREDLLTDTRLSSMLHQYLPHFFDKDSLPPLQRVEGTTEVSVSPVAISHVEEEDRLYPYSLPPLAQRFIGNSLIVLETTQPAVSAKECRVATEATDITAGTATVKGEDPWAARSLPLVLPPSLPPVFDDDFMPPEQTVEDTYEVSVATEATVDFGVYRSAAKCPVPILPPSLPLDFDIDYKLPGEAVEGITMCPVASETTNDVSTHLKEYMAADQSPPDPAVLTPSSLCILDPDHKLTEETKEDETESSLATEIAAATSIVQGEDLLGDKCPAPMQRSKQPVETVVATESSVGNREDPSAATSLHSVLPSSLPLLFDNDHKQLRKKVEEPSPWTLEEATDYLTGIDNESEERNVEEEVGGLKREADRAHSKSSNGTVSSEREETILGRMGFLAMNHTKKITFLKMEEKEKTKKLKDDEKERKEMKAKEEEQKKKKKEIKEREKEKKKEMKEREKEMKEREKEKKKEMKAEKKREKLAQEKREKERIEKEKTEKKRLEGLIKINNAMMKDRIKKEKKWSEELKRREKAQAEFLEMERKIQEKEEKKIEKMRKEERKRLEEKKKRASWRWN